MSERDLNAPEHSPANAAVRLIRDIGQLADEELRERLRRLDSVGRGIEAAFIAHLAEFDERGLYKKLGYGSLFYYCRAEFGHSESRVCKRIQAARIVRRFPAVLERLATGRIHVTAVGILAPHLTEENLIPLLDAAENATKFDLLRLVAALAPRDDMKDIVMRFPERAETPNAPLRLSPPASGTGTDVSKATPPEGRTEAAPVISESVAAQTAASPPPRAEQVYPLSAERVRFGFTGSASLREKLERVKDLMWHKNPEGRLEAVVEALVDDYLARKDPARVPPRTSTRRAERDASGSRRIPAEIRRRVWIRDQGACAYTGPKGHRCGGRRGLEVDHIAPFARGGSSTDIDNLRLLCRAHNQWTAKEAGLPPPSRT